MYVLAKMVDFEGHGQFFTEDLRSKPMPNHCTIASLYCPGGGPSDFWTTGLALTLGENEVVGYWRE